jgi:thiamine transport system substrate-binding protein
MAHRGARLITSVAVLTTAALAGCSAGTSSGGAEREDDTGGNSVTLVTHDSWSMPEEVIAAFEEESGYSLEVVPSGDAGSLTNKLVLTKGNPLGDVVYGIDNTFATRAVDEDVLAEHVPAALPASAEEHRLEGAAGDQLTPVDWGDVCVNADDRWFARNDLTPPRTLDDLLDPAYEGLLVTPGASSSSPGFSFLLATIGQYGEDGWQEYWAGLLDNGAKVVSDWSEAYEVDFTAGGGGGDRPLVVSYHSSPPFTIPEGERRPTTSALLETCFRQVEYAGVLAGAANPDGAEALVDFMVGPAFQEALAENMYVVPVDDSVELPPLWEKWAQPASEPIPVPASEIAERRSEWIRAWSDVTAR